ncbi:MAG TPA: hypothetical protein VND70_08560 [Acidimicrobiales bacterium]|nr:hypothetical protein [Acidimicrobiales bacterium]
MATAGLVAFPVGALASTVSVPAVAAVTAASKSSGTINQFLAAQPTWASPMASAAAGRPTGVSHRGAPSSPVGFTAVRGSPNASSEHETLAVVLTLGGLLSFVLLLRIIRGRPRRRDNPR